MNLPKAQIIVLIFAYKKATVHSEFNFETIYQSYQNFMKSHKQQMNIDDINRAQFLKLFLDLIDKGFLCSRSEMDITNVNTKNAFVVTLSDFRDLLNQRHTMEQLNLPSAIYNFAMAK